MQQKLKARMAAHIEQAAGQLQTSLNELRLAERSTTQN
jgi:hypothetical protein